jgi:hypothetical protein
MARLPMRRTQSAHLLRLSALLANSKTPKFVILTPRKPVTRFLWRGTRD